MILFIYIYYKLYHSVEYLYYKFVFYLLTQLRNSRDNRKSQLDYVFSHDNCTYLINDESTFHRTQLSDNNYRAITRQSRVNHVLISLWHLWRSQSRGKQQSDAPPLLVLIGQGVIAALWRRDWVTINHWTSIDDNSPSLLFFVFLLLCPRTIHYSPLP